jgi:hypothetical protein
MRRILFLLGAFGTLHAGTVSMDIASPGNIFAPQQYVIDRGVYIGPYTLDINGVTTLGLCVDFAHWSQVGEYWDSFQTAVAPTGMNNTYVYQANVSNPNVDAVTLKTYEEEAYLYRQIVSTLLPADRIAIQEAAWSITYSGFDISGNSDAQFWAAAAANPANYLNVNLTGIYIFSDVHGINNGEQEFMVDPARPVGQVSSVPEPPSIGLCAALLGLLCGWLLRRRGLRGRAAAA